ATGERRRPSVTRGPPAPRLEFDEPVDRRDPQPSARERAPRGGRTMRTHRPITTILILALFVALASGVTPTAGIAAQPAPPSIDWTKCHRNLGFKFECARVSVPLDYSHPNGAQISLAMVRLPAKDQAHKIGSLF